MGKTANYSFPTYEENDSPDLTGYYNDAVALIDEFIKSNETAAADASAAAIEAQGKADDLVMRVERLEGAKGDFNPLETDKTLTVHQLAGAKVTENGIVYIEGE